MDSTVKPFAIAIFLLLFNAASYGQEDFLTWSKNRPLRWDDFSGRINDTSNFEAECFAQVRYSYKLNSLKEFTFDVQAIFDKSTSWIKPVNKSNALLKHEQVHFDIAQLYACKLRQAFSSYTYTSNFAAEILSVFDKLNREYHYMQKMYDEQSNHSLVSAKQKQWEAFIDEELMNATRQEAAGRDVAEIK